MASIVTLKINTPLSLEFVQTQAGDSIQDYHDKVFIENNFAKNNDLKFRSIVKIESKNSAGEVQATIYRRLVGGNKVEGGEIGLTYQSYCSLYENADGDIEKDRTVEISEGDKYWNWLMFYLFNPYYAVKISVYLGTISVLLGLLSVTLGIISVTK